MCLGNPAWTTKTLLLTTAAKVTSAQKLTDAAAAKAMAAREASENVHARVSTVADFELETIRIFV